jgi:hypothetical protein
MMASGNVETTVRTPAVICIFSRMGFLSLLCVRSPLWHQIQDDDLVLKHFVFTKFFLIDA